MPAEYFCEAGDLRDQKIPDVSVCGKIILRVFQKLRESADDIAYPAFYRKKYNKNGGADKYCGRNIEPAAQINEECEPFAETGTFLPDNCTGEYGYAVEKI